MIIEVDTECTAWTVTNGQEIQWPRLLGSQQNTSGDTLSATDRGPDTSAMASR